MAALLFGGAAFFHRFAAALLAKSLLASGVNADIRVTPPLSPPARPEIDRLDGGLSTTSPVAIRAIKCASWLESRGRLGFAMRSV